ncbi:MAG: hypothetical protein V7K21_13455 [Nostoc sp.]|uniref:hypothetical protein n=1 Tax=Nostoc sp. TaxID=1180 RepID=UPI002FFABEAB
MIIQVLQLIDSQGQKTGYWRLTARTCEKSDPQPMCNHLHSSYKEAWDCLEAWQKVLKLTGDSL